MFLLYIEIHEIIRLDVTLTYALIKNSNAYFEVRYFAINDFTVFMETYGTNSTSNL